MALKGKAHVFGDDVNTDEIVPARYLNMSDPAELARHCMEDADPDFAKRVGEGDIMVGGENFGCGSSREHAPIAIKASGVSCVIARSFARIFFRNAINIALPIIICPEAVENIKSGDTVAVDLDAGEVELPQSGRKFSFPPFAKEIQEIIGAGGLMPFVKVRLAGK